MAITMSQAKVDSSAREDLLNSSVDTTIFGGNIAANREEAQIYMQAYYEQNTGAKLAGVTEDFAQSVGKKIEEYCANVEKVLETMETTDSKIAFQGDAIGNALTAFITGVKESAFSYLNKLKAAENQIVNSVSKAYETQDTDISSNLTADTSKLNS